MPTHSLQLTMIHYKYYNCTFISSNGAPPIPPPFLIMRYTILRVMKC